MSNDSVRSKALTTIVFGGLLVGIFDAIDATVFFGFRGASPGSIFRFVASGLLGPPALKGGVGTALVGLSLHFAVALSIATVYYILSLRISPMTARPYLAGPIFGVVAYFVMSYLVVPLSKAPPGRGFVLAIFLNGIIGHALLVGLPIAICANRSART